MTSQPEQLEIIWEQITQKLENANLFYGHGASDASSESIWILSKCLEITPLEAFERLDQACSPAIIAQALKIADERISSRRPLAYILGEAWLIGVPFYSDERSIIPRSFIAELIEDGTLDPWLPPSGKALDLCTGNGSLAILLALSYPDISVAASDLSSDAIALAKRNLERHHLSSQIEIYQGDLWEPLPEPNEDNRFDLIVCNPPYVNSDSMSKLPQEYLAEPNMALAGGTDGMDLVRKIMSGARAYLNPRGALLLEIGNEYDYFCEAFPEIPLTWIEVSAGDEQVVLIEAENLP